MQLIYLVNIWLKNHSKDNGDDFHANLVFDQQPDMKQIGKAVNAEPIIYRHTDSEYFMSALSNCLRTYGVPRVGEMVSESPDGTQLVMPAVAVKWFANVLSPNRAASGVELGSIQIQVKPVHVATPAAPAGQSEVKERKPRVVKAAAEAKRGRPAKAKAESGPKKQAAKPKAPSEKKVRKASPVENPYQHPVTKQ